MRMARSCRVGVELCLLTVLWLSAAAAQPAEDFYLGKRELTLITSSAAGGGYDQYSRLLARHMVKYLPGNPTIVVQNMIGGGGIRSANFLYNVAPRDGTVLEMIMEPREGETKLVSFRDGITNEHQSVSIDGREVRVTHPNKLYFSKGIQLSKIGGSHGISFNPPSPAPPHCGIA